MIISEKNGWVLAQILGSNYVLIILTLFNSLSTLAKETREDKIIPVYSQPVLHHALRDHRKSHIFPHLHAVAAVDEQKL